MTNFNQFLEKELNSPQKEAVNFILGPAIVIAGAGSGKTRVITTRMANLILNNNIAPESIIALTFTNKAATEMKERLANFLDNSKKLPFVGTFHSYCLLLLRSNPNLLNFINFSIIDSDDQKSLVRKIIKKYGLEKQFSATDIIYQISNYKNKINYDFDEFTLPIVKEIYQEYETEKQNSHSFDFDDLMLEVLKIFKSNINFRTNFQQKIRHILVDEYQDTNMVQHELLKLMALNENNKFNIDSLCAVGDEDQSIYSWRGAIATNMQNFQKDFAPVKLIKIEQNYRTVTPILEAANNIILNNKNRTNKKLWSEKKATDRILHISCRSGKQEAYAIANIIENLPKEIILNDIAILYRTHYQSRSIEEALIANSIPYKIVGGIRFYERKEIKDLLAYLRLIINPYDKISLERIINCPNRGLGDKFEEILNSEYNLNPLLDFKQILNLLINKTEHKLSATKKEAIIKFLDLYKKLENLEQPSEIVEVLIDEIEYFSFLEKEHDQQEADTKKDNVKEFVQSIYNFEKDAIKNNLHEFLYQVSLMQEKTENLENSKNQIQCMTLHAAKGLEFNTVIITGLEEGLLPSSRSLNERKEIEEERRLFYVGITRAKERLLLFHANYRNNYGQISDQVISRFLTEIPDNLINAIDVTEKSQIQITSEFKNWLGVKSNTVLTFQDFAKDLSKNMTFKEQNQDNLHNRKLKNLKSKTNKFSQNYFNSPKIIQTNNLIWSKNQLVLHPKFGVGLIKNIESGSDGNYNLTIAFKIGEKKILSSFVTKV